MGSATAEGEERAISAVKEALNSPLLNDNNIEGATYILLNITYGDSEVTMDEIGEITDFIQEEAGSTADIIWGHGKDESLGDKLCVTLVATGFKSSPITGFEKAPERKVVKLEEEAKNEITTPLTSPTQQVVPTVTSMEEPFLKSTVEEVKETVAENPVKEETVAVVEKTVLDLEWDLAETTNTTHVETTTVSVQTETVETVAEEPKRYFLEDETENKLNTIAEQETRSPLSQEEIQRRNLERIERIQQYNNKLKKAEGLKELEDEPAFVRRNIQLDAVRKSDESRSSRFGLSDDNGSLRTNNSFLHDNVD
jgi:cell division protein FtsZ